jgi:hypothetical protein
MAPLIFLLASGTGAGQKRLKKSVPAMPLFPNFPIQEYCSASYWPDPP